MPVFFGIKRFKNTKKARIVSIFSKIPTNECFADLSLADSAWDYYDEYF